MKYTILGAGSGLPHPDFHLSSLVVQTGEHNFLLDCGEGISKQLIRHGFSNSFLDAVLISHFHPDHVTGLYMLIQMMYLENRTKPLNLFLPERQAAFMESMHLFYTFEQRLPFELKVYEMTEAEKIYPQINIARTDHLNGYADFLQKHDYPNPMNSYCIAVTEDGKTLLYTSDVSTYSNIGHLLEKADVIITDALHPDAGMIIRLAEDQTKQLILTHGISDTLREWVNEKQRDNVSFAAENQIRQL